MPSPFPFDNSYARLPERFHVRLNPTPVAAPRILRINHALAEELGIDPAALTADILAGNRVPDGAEPLAAAYAGHQFGHFNPALGDGRAVLLGEVVTPSGLRRDIQLKGAGPTPWSRGGDGRAAVGPVMREYIVSEAMAALGIPTTRALAAVATGEPVYRETALPGAVLTRVAASHIRVGTFQYFAARGDAEAVRLLADHVIARHYPEAAGAPNPYRAFLEGVLARQAALIARWLCVGFIHGVMNTDNCAVSGETIDFGPCAFLDEYDPAKVFSSIDRQGRYAYGNQPRIVVWNLARLAETILPLLHENEETAVAIAQEVLAGFSPLFEAAYFGGLRRKIGLTKDDPSDVTLVNDLLKLMAESGADFTVTFRRLADAATGDDALRDDFTDAAAFDQWAARWRWRLGDESASPQAIRTAMRAVNPAFIPRNHQIEAALAAAIERDDLTLFEALLTALARPFDDQPEHAYLAVPPVPALRVTKTFCGT
jgi:uncharacterized protein YdiU (UPF0061 family)